MTDAEDRYLSAESEEYVDRICRKAELHSVRRRVEAQAALHAALAVLLRAMHADGDRGEFRTLVNDIINDHLEREQQIVSEERPSV